jgi:hypothetical protein
MSGVEAAGFILGVLPLLISAMEHYNDSLDPIKAFMRWERELPQFIRKLRNQEVHYQQTLRLLLEPVTNEEELAEMIRDPMSNLWKDEVIAESLRERLGDGWNAYRDVMRDVDEVMRTIARKLDLEKDTRVSKNELESMLLVNPRSSSGGFAFKKRAKFGLTKKRIKALLEELDADIKELERLTDRGEKLEQRSLQANPKGAWKVSFAAPWEKLRQSARQLHQAVTKWNCPCQASHATNLELEQRLEVTRGKRMGKSSGLRDGLCFNVSFTTIEKAPFQWKEAEIKIEPAQPEQLRPDLVSRSSTRSSTLVSFSVDETEPTGANGEPSPRLCCADFLEVDDVCSVIKRASRSASRMGFFLDSQGKLRGIYPVIEEPKNPFEGTVSLSELLQASSTAKGAKKIQKLSRKDRYSLAVTLASSTLQLCSTPWLPSTDQRLSASDIVFVRTGRPDKPFDLEHPYLKQSQKALPASEARPQQLVFCSPDNATLLSLALMLLELYFNEPYETYLSSTDSDLPSASVPNVFASLAIAQQWVTSERENLSAAFLGAISHCLRSFADPRSSLQDSVFLQTAVEEIVVPLQVELWSFLGVTNG